MRDRINSRFESTVPGDRIQPTGKKNTLNGVFVGFVKDNRDVHHLGRLRVWIPELGGEPSNEKHWYTVQYCTPFGGATNLGNNVSGSTSYQETQQSFGMVGIPPYLEVQVLVVFINGDPNRGVFLGQIYQSGMTHGLPDHASDFSYQGGDDTVQMKPPITEYNAKNNEDPKAPNSPRFEPLHLGLYFEGLYTDMERGVTDASMHRDAVPQVMGFKTPQGHTIYMDDGKVATDSDQNPILQGNVQARANGAVEFIRLRTKGGTQILINDTTGYIYMNTKNGNAWFELSDTGVALYSRTDFDIRTEGNVNWRVDGNMKLEVIGNMDWWVGGDTTINHSGKTDLYNGAGIAIQSAADFNVKTAGAQRLEAGGVIHVSAGPEINLHAGKIHQNTKPGQPARPPKRLAQSVKKDPGMGNPPDYKEGDINSIIEQKDLVTHEPWRFHPRGGVLYSNGSVTQNCAPTVQQGLGSGGSVPVPAPGGPTSPGTSAPAAPNDGNFVYPTTGATGAGYGQDRGSRTHEGVDIPVPVGTPVVASSGGTISVRSDPDGYGQYIVMDNGSGYETVYGHLSQISVPDGSTVKAGDTIGLSGNSGNSTGPHLHFEMRQGGTAIDPGTYLPNLRTRGLQFSAGESAVSSNPSFVPPATSSTQPTYNTSDMNLSQNGFDKLVSSIPFTGIPTKDAAGDWVVGYGSKITEDQALQYLTGSPMSQDYAQTLLRQDISGVEDTLRTLPATVNQDQFDALVSAGLNIGAEEVVNGPVGQEMAAGNPAGAASALQCYSTVNGQYDPALGSRRAGEGAGLTGGAMGTPPSGVQYSDDTTLRDANGMSLSEEGASNLSLYEGLRTQAYDDGGGQLTIGIGHALTPTELSSGTININGQLVPWQNGITTEQAYALKQQDSPIYEQAVRDAVSVPITQNQFDAMTSLAFNIGPSAFRGSTLVKKLNAGDTQGAADQFLVWNKDNGQVVQGLVNRRTSERDVFLH